MVRRMIAIVVLTAASLMFASRFHRPPAEVILAPDEPVVAFPAPSTTSSTSRPPRATAQTSAVTTSEPVTTTTAAPTTTTTSSTTTTIPIPTATAGADVFEGPRLHTNWGWVKVEISVIDGVMVDIELVMVPQATKRSVALTKEHEPTLRQQALARQSPQVDVIAGATVISDGYGRSVRGAMREAGLWPPQNA